ncbi:MAG: Vitamin B12 dependent methionine synthase activation subunit [Clostridia bacterium]|nr:Vitamin B12 dependent methionine synthase activation subunit [Clostridia bacterium]
MKIDRNEVLRYMGQRREAPSEDIMQTVESVCTEMERTVKPRYIYKVLPITSDGERVFAEGTVFESKKLAGHLRETENAAILCATLGVEADNIIRRSALTGTLNASAAQAAGAAMIEQVLDEVCVRIAEDTGLFTLSRFSPGYGDWTLSDQRTMLSLADATKRIGITLTDSMMMLPTKSVTAIVGLSDKCKHNNTRSCDSCNKKDCDFRR